MSDKIRVLIVDDSALMREALKAILSTDPAIEVVGIARDGKEGVEKAMVLKPNVITMDLKMPIMTGLEATESIMRELPTPIIVVSSIDPAVTAKALSMGAMDLVAVTDDIDAIAADLISKVKIASRVKPLRRMKLNACAVKAPKSVSEGGPSKVVAIGVSTGGPQALQEVLAKMPPLFPAGVLVVQHMSSGFIEGLAQWLNTTSCLHVTVAKAGEILTDGAIMLAPDDLHLKIDRNGRISLSENINKGIFHVPSIDVMMQSVAEAFAGNAIGVIMTGMGSDGVAGIRAIKKAGGVTIAQDEKTSVIYGMNKVAVDAKLIDYVVPLGQISEQIVRLV
jgi:two-component system chemotaxis response regulator CheB